MTKRLIELCAGIGGIRLGFEVHKYKTVYSCDINKKCKLTYDLNFKKPGMHVGDLRDVPISSLPDFDWLTAGFPCQPFSAAGKKQGFMDEKDRGNIFFDLCEILRIRQPTGFLFENVKNLVSHDKGETFRIMMNTLDKLGYYTHHKVLNSKDYGIPQNRERVFLVGFRDKKDYDNFQWPEPRTLCIKIHDLLDDTVDDKYYITPNSHKYGKEILEGVVDNTTAYQWRYGYLRENKSKVVPTLTASSSILPIIKTPRGIRFITPEEAIRFQGFPSRYKFPEGLTDSQKHHQVGNSVTVPVIASIVHKINT